MKSVLDVAEQAVNVFAGDEQAPLLGIVEFPRVPRLYDLCSHFRHYSST
jgi:hypothetical protein